MKARVSIAAIVALLAASTLASAQAKQGNADFGARKNKLQVDYVGFRPATYETEAAFEPDNERPNEGGFASVYLTNTSDEDVDLRFWRLNGKDESYWRLDGPLAWDRLYDSRLTPGQTTVLEINAVTDDFQPGEPFNFFYIDRTWRPALRYRGTLQEDPVQISLIRIYPGRKTVEVHVRNKRDEPVELDSLSIVGRDSASVSWRGAALESDGHAIGRIVLFEPIQPSSLLIAKVGLVDAEGKRHVYNHRRAFVDQFPIGCWSNSPDLYGLLRSLHIDTVVRGGRSDDPFYSEAAEKYGLNTLVHTGMKPIRVDMVRDLGGHPAVSAWMLQDEPDWHTPANIVLHVNESVRAYDRTEPTFVTLCRNVKFFEYGPIADIPCMDHYAVTAPSSSKWPKPYGTRLEETAYYTRDLKAASEPKPIWIWSQAIADWNERPKRPVPTPDEIAAQLLLNLGRGAKGILWFNYDHDMAERYPDAREAVQRWGRVLEVTREDFLGSEPYEAEVAAPDKIDVASLVTWNKVLLCVTNLDYEIHTEAYPFTPKENVQVEIDLPSWIEPAHALNVSPEEVSEVSFSVKDERALIELGDLRVGKVIALVPDSAAKKAYEDAYAAALEEE